MQVAQLEHANVTVTDPKKTAEMLCRLFGWHIRWQGEAKDNGFTIHVGSDDTYIAVYSKGEARQPEAESYVMRGGLNHLAVTVDDLDEIEQRVIAEGLTPHLHADYEPGRRFYFDDPDGIEFEVVSYV